jgi:hypothetical protein
MVRPAVHKHAFFLYGVVVGLAIQDAIHSGAVFTRPWDWTDGPLHVARLLVFVTLIARFYMGAGTYFARVYESEWADQRYPSKSYALDFLFGFIHFMLFSFMALTIGLPSRWWFLVFLQLVLVFDILWWAVSHCCRLSTASGIRGWAILNLATVVVNFLFGAAATSMCVLSTGTLDLSKLTAGQCAICEAVTFLPVIAASLIDLAGMIRDRSYIETWINHLIPTTLTESRPTLRRVPPFVVGDDYPADESYP